MKEAREGGREQVHIPLLEEGPSLRSNPSVFYCCYSGSAFHTQLQELGAQRGCVSLVGSTVHCPMQAGNDSLLDELILLNRCFQFSA
jgi:hypothetical protein